MGRQMTDRISCCCIPGQQNRLAATAAKIFFLLWTTAARLLHPGVATKSVERRGFSPDTRERLLLDIVEMEIGNDMGGMAGQHLTCGSNAHVCARPASHARFRFCSEIVHLYEDNFHRAPIPLPRL